jgi:FSR family fosmidomycin resistance protein-like MFS transporter
MMALLLCVVALRSFTGFALPIPWKSVEHGVLFLALASFAGKASGGFLADRIGWRPLCGAMFVIAAAMVTRYNTHLLAVCFAVFCIQTTTGVTLAGVQSIFPNRPGFAFGLPCIALLLGAIPFFLPHPVGQIQSSLIVVICLSAMLAITGALTIRKKGSNVTCRGKQPAAC